MTPYEKWSLIGMWLGATGTCGAVVYALFGSIMKRWFNKPKLELHISDKFPHCAKVKKIVLLRPILTWMSWRYARRLSIQRSIAHNTVGSCVLAYMC